MTGKNALFIPPWIVTSLIASVLDWTENSINWFLAHFTVDCLALPHHWSCPTSPHQSILHHLGCTGWLLRCGLFWSPQETCTNSEIFRAGLDFISRSLNPNHFFFLIRQIFKLKCLYLTRFPIIQTPIPRGSSEGIATRVLPAQSDYLSTQSTGHPWFHMAGCFQHAILVNHLIHGQRH